MPHRSVGWTIFSLLVTFLPELVDVLNTTRSRRWQAKTNVSALPLSAKLLLNCPTMGCVACVNKVDTSIRQSKSAANIIEETSWLTDSTTKGGMAELTIRGRTEDEIKEIVDEVVAVLGNAGFQCSVDTLAYRVA